MILTESWLEVVAILIAIGFFAIAAFAVFLALWHYSRKHEQRREFQRQIEEQYRREMADDIAIKRAMTHPDIVRDEQVAEAVRKFKSRRENGDDDFMFNKSGCRWMTWDD